MSTQQLTTEAMALPLAERASLAQLLWRSIDAGLSDADERETVREAIHRDRGLTSGAVVGRTHEEVMRAARETLVGVADDAEERTFNPEGIALAIEREQEIESGSASLLSQEEFLQRTGGTEN